MCGTVAAIASAHHSFTMFDRTQQVLIVGTVKEWAFNSPHTWLYVEASDKNGEAAVWGFEGAAPVGAIRMGVTGTTFTPGEAVRVVTSPIKDGRPAGGVCFVLKEKSGDIARFNDGSCAAEAVLARWKTNGWLEGGKHLDSHPSGSAGDAESR
jgi:hypothetical protein